MILILHNIRSVHNAGSMFRTADAAGVERIILSGYTPAPLDRFGRERGDFAKVSLGAEKTVPWRHVKTLRSVLAKLKRDGHFLAALEQDARSQNLFDFARQSVARKNGRAASAKPLVLIVGNEVRGISPALRGACDAILEIPMRGTKESLNVSVAAGVALFALAQPVGDI